MDDLDLTQLLASQDANKAAPALSFLQSSSGIDPAVSTAVDPYNATGYNNPQLEKAFQASLGDVPSSSGAALESLPQQDDKPWYNSLFHGGGSDKMTDQELAKYAAMGNQLQTETDPQVQAQLQERMDALSNPDRGGYMGALGRMLSGSGQTTGENIGFGAMKIGGPIALQLIQRYLANKASNSVMNRNASNSQALLGQMQSNING